MEHLINNENNDVNIKRNSVVDYIVEAVRSGELTEGEPLTERGLALKLNVSRTPVREAFRSLERVGLLQTLPHRGTRVASYSSEKISILYEVREVLEGLAGRLATTNCTTEELAEMGQLLIESEDLLKENRVDELARTNIRFHSLLAQMSHNEFLIQQLRDLRDNISLLFSESMRMKERPRHTLSEHWIIYNSISGGQSDIAETAARLHIRNAFTNLKNKFFETESDDNTESSKD